MKKGDKVVCIDDEGWLIQSTGPQPVKGCVYCVRDATKFGAVLAISLIGFHEDGYYRACRFVPLCQHQEMKHEEASA